jgi:hypothetical protein
VSYLVPVRLRRGVVGETQRTCHLVPVPNVGTLPAVLTALCEQQFVPGQTEQLAKLCAMPCVACLVLAASTVGETQP